MLYGVPIVQYCGYTVSRNNYHDMCRVQQSSELRACEQIRQQESKLQALQ